MSGASPPTNEPVFPTTEVDAEALRMSILWTLAWPVRFVAFWAAVSFPVLYLPLLQGGLDGEEAVLLVALLALNIVALVVGHTYGWE